MEIIYSSADEVLKEALFGRIKEDIENAPGKHERVILVVPAQSTLSAEEEAFRRIGGKGFLTFNVESGEKLRQDVLHQTGGSGRTAINTIGRGMVLRRAAEVLSRDLAAFGGVCRDPRFTDMAGDFIVQMKQNGYCAADVGKLAKELPSGSLLSGKLSDMALVAQYYEDAMAGKYTDSEDQLLFVTGKLAQSSYIRTSKIYYYGFYTFTKREAEFLRTLDSCCSGLCVALLCGEGPRFEASRRTMAMLGGRAVRVSGSAEPAEKVCITSCASPFTEAESIAAEIIRLMREENYAYSDIAVLAPDSEGYASGIRRVLESYGIPVFMDETRPILHSSCAEAVSALVELSGGEFKTRDVLRLLKSGVLELDEETVWGFENYAKQFHISGNRFLKPLKYKNDDIGEESFAAFEQLRSRVAELIAPFAEGMQAAENVSAQAAFFKGFLAEKLALEEGLEHAALIQAEEGYAETAEETRQMWGLLTDLLDQMTELMGSEELSCEEFGRMLLSALADVKVGVLPQSAGRVQLGSVKRTLLQRKKAVFIAGFCDGLVPAEPGSDGIFTGRELAKLSERNVVLSKPSELMVSEEIFMIYRSVDCAEKLLWIGVPAAGSGGEGLNPSPLLKDITQIFPEAVRQSDAENSGDPMLFLQGSALSAGKTALALRGGLSGEEIPEVWKAAYNVLSKRSPQLRAGLLYRRDPMPLGKDRAKDLYSRAGSVSLSPSRLDSFASCPFRHFVGYGIRPLEPRPFGIASAEIGDIYHEALLRLCEKLSARARAKHIAMTDPDSDWMKVTEKETEAMLSVILDDMARESLGGVMDSSKADSFRAQRIRIVCLRFAWHMIKQVRAGRIDSMWFETGFGRGAVFPPIVLQTEAGKVYVEGKIDRVDLMPGPSGGHFVKIIDYKSGNMKFDKELIERGLSLQLMTYLEGALGKGDSKPAGVYYFRISSEDTESVLEDLSSEELSGKVLEEINKKYRLDGITVEDESVLSDLDEELLSLGSSEVVNVRRKKDGTLTGGIISPADMEAFRGQFRQALLSCAERLCMGDISVAPKRLGNKYDSCRFCGYSSICLKSL